MTLAVIVALNPNTPNCSITCIQRPLKGSNESGLLQQVVFKCRYYFVDLRRVTASDQWSLKAGGLLIQLVSKTGLTLQPKSLVDCSKDIRSNLAKGNLSERA